MKFLHTSDLHIGKMVNGFSMLEEQKHILNQIIEAAKTRKVSAVFLSGDLYDRSVPAAQAVTVLDDFLTELIALGIQVFAIGGNHDCGERVGFAGRILEKKGLFMEGVLQNPVRFVDIEGVRVHMIPFAKPAVVRALYHCKAETYDDCMKEILKTIAYKKEGANVLLTHQFVVNQGREPELSDSETRVFVGGTDQVEASQFKDFTYVALGHIHGQQQIGDGPVYYSGSPIKYSFSEVHHKKSVLYGEILTEPKPALTALEPVRLTPIHDMRKIRGPLVELIRPEIAESADAKDYLLAILTNEEELIDPIGTLRSVYPNVMQLQMERRTLAESRETGLRGGDWSQKSPAELFEDFYQQVTGKVLSEEQNHIINQVSEEAKEELS